MRYQTANLLKKRVFLPLFLTQFFGAFNDNAFKLSVLTLISYHLSSSQVQSEYYQALAGALFIIPFFLFSATAGQLADKYDKAKMTILVKFFEIFLMCVGAYAFYHGKILLLMALVAGMGVHSTFFGPIKYAILPDHLPKEQLMSATALIEASTFMAILLGTTLGALAIGQLSSQVLIAVLITILAACIGLIASFFIPPAPTKVTELAIDWHVWHATKTMLKEVKKNKLYPPMLAISWFWLIGAVMLTKLPDYTHYVLNAETSVLAVFLALFSIGIALGSLAINYLLVGKITLCYVPFIMCLLSVFVFDLYWVSPQTSSSNSLITLPIFFTSLSHWRIVFDFFLFSFCGGMFVVPLYAYLQSASEQGMRARIIAANNILNSLFMVVGTVLVMVLLHFKVNIKQVFLVLGVLNVVMALALWPSLSATDSSNENDYPPTRT